jgi:hypothetical protein
VVSAQHFIQRCHPEAFCWRNMGTKQLVFQQSLGFFQLAANISPIGHVQTSLLSYSAYFLETPLRQIVLRRERLATLYETLCRLNWLNAYLFFRFRYVRIARKKLPNLINYINENCINYRQSLPSVAIISAVTVLCN